MKKGISALLLVLLLASVSLAAKAPAPKVTPKAVATETRGLGVGVEGGLPYVRLSLSDSQSVDLGLMYASVGGVATATNTIGFLGRYESKLVDITNNLSTYWNAGLTYSSVSTTTTASTLGLFGGVGAELAIASNVGIYSNLTLGYFQSVSTAGTATSNFGVLVGSATAYSGIRVYL